MARKATLIGPHALALITLARVYRCPAGLPVCLADNVALSPDRRDHKVKLPAWRDNHDQ